MKKRQRKQWNSKSIRALRRHLGLTQMEMAEEIGSRQQTISEWETGMYQPRGASATLLSIIAERSEFNYQVKKPEEGHDEH